MHVPCVKGVAAALAGLFILTAAPRPAASAQALDQGVLEELNSARTHPAQYARKLLREAEADGAYTGSSSFAYEDPDALEEAVDFLSDQDPLPPLRHDPRLAAAALAHTAAQGRGGGVGHVSPGGETLGQRLQRHGLWAGLAAEDISYGYHTPRDIVRQLIVDSGIPGRGHRKNIFGRNFQVAGVGCGPHRAYGSMCVIDFAGAMVAR